jgi:hypothetical protein
MTSASSANGPSPRSICDVVDPNLPPAFPKSTVELDLSIPSLVYVRRSPGDAGSVLERRETLLDASHAGGYSIPLTRCDPRVLSAADRYRLDYSCGDFTEGVLSVNYSSASGQYLSRTHVPGGQVTRNIPFESCRAH